MTADTIVMCPEMHQPPSVLKGNVRVSELPCCTLDVPYLESLFEILQEVNRDAAKYELSEMQRVPDQPEGEFEKLKKDVTDACKIDIQIVGTRGDLISTTDCSILQESKLPDAVRTIVFDSAALMQMMFNRRPQNALRVELDFGRPSIFDFRVMPSARTSNSSGLQVTGRNATWVEGTHRRILGAFNTVKNRRLWLHRTYTYDVLLWFLVLPLLFWNMNKLQSHLVPLIGGMSILLQVALYIYIFLMALTVFRIAFSYARWLFPYMELQTRRRRGARAQRLIFSPVLVGIAGRLIYDVVKSILNAIF